MRAKLLLIGVFVGLLAVAPAPARAGGFGGFGGVGLHFGEALREGGGQGRWLDAGGGLEVTLGTRDSRLHGRLRFAYAALVDVEGGVQHTGLVSVGASIQLLDPEAKFGLYVPIDVGVSPLVTQLRIFVFVDAGVGLRLRLTERLDLFAELTGMLRFEKSLSGGPALFLGARVLLD